ncbi:DnaB-like helicase C-terminal domain-containing protein [Clostridium butyricum]|nr:DnaB-like helicase C-terminal domain-containing protein [Clostridium butyricum]AXB83416.1 hypothetical protein DRB99_00130 [Clostridium butyricum]
MERFNLDVEIQIIGNCINSTETFLKVMDKGIEAEDFYNTNNQKLFTAITQCYIAKNTTDVLTFNGFLKANGVTITDTTSILSGTIIFTDITPYLNELLELRVVRERLRFAKEIQEGILKTDEDIKKRLASIDFIKSKVGNDNTITTLNKVKIVDVYTLEKIPTGFESIDERILGFAMGSLVIVTGYNGNGKSTLINEMCIAESMSRGYKVFAYSPELTNSNLKSWLYPTIANDDHFISKSYKGQNYKTLGKMGIRYIDDWISDKLLIYTDDSITSDEKRLLRDMNNLAQQGVKVFIIDNLMKIDLVDSFKNEYMAQKVFVNKLKDFARKYNVIVHLVAHPKKPQAGNTKITKFDVAGSGDITNLADYVVSISRITDEDRGKSPDLIDKDAVIKIMKDRIKGSSELYSTFKFDAERKRFYSNQNELNRDYGYINNEELVQVEINSNEL